MDEIIKKVTTVTVVTTRVTTLKRCISLFINNLNRWLRLLRPFSHLLFIIIIHSTFYKFLRSIFCSCVQLENYRNGRNQLLMVLIFNYLQFIKVVTEVVTVVTKSHNYLQFNKLRLSPHQN